jgi:hypothetical protein
MTRLGTPSGRAAFSSAFGHRFGASLSVSIILIRPSYNLTLARPHVRPAASAECRLNPGNPSESHQCGRPCSTRNFSKASFEDMVRPASISSRPPFMPATVSSYSRRSHSRERPEPHPVQSQGLAHAEKHSRSAAPGARVRDVFPCSEGRNRQGLCQRVSPFSR